MIYFSELNVAQQGMCVYSVFNTFNSKFSIIFYCEYYRQKKTDFKFVFPGYFRILYYSVLSTLPVIAL